MREVCLLKTTSGLPCTKGSKRMREQFQEMAAAVAALHYGADAVSIGNLFVTKVVQVEAMVSDAKAESVPPKGSSTKAERDEEVARLSIEIWWKNVQIDINSYLTAREQAEPDASGYLCLRALLSCVPASHIS